MHVRYLILLRTKSVCGQRAAMLPWTVVYTAKPVLAALQTSHCRRRDAATVISRESQSHEAWLWLVVFNDIKAAVLVQIHTPKPMVCWSRMIKYKSVILTHLCKSDFTWITAQLYEVLAAMRAGRCSIVCAGAVPPGAKCPRLSMAIHFTSTGSAHFKRAAEFCFLWTRSVEHRCQPCTTSVCVHWTLSNRNRKRVSSVNDEHHPTPLWCFCDFSVANSQNKSLYLLCYL